jgi:hypothetical protein
MPENGLGVFKREKRELILQPAEKRRLLWLRLDVHSEAVKHRKEPRREETRGC